MSALATRPTAVEKRRFHADFPFVKAVSPVALKADSGDLSLSGYANTWAQDRDGEYVDPGAFDKYLGAFLKNNPILLWQHNHDWPLGQVAMAKTDATGLFVNAIVPKPSADAAEWRRDAYELIAAGIVRTFSIGGLCSYTVENVMEDDEKWVITEVEWYELSVVSVPSNATSIYQATMKAMRAGRDEAQGSELDDNHVQQMVQLLGLEPITDPLLVRSAPDGRRDLYEQIATIFEKARGVQAPAYDEYRSVAESTDVVAGNLPALLKAAEVGSSVLAKLNVPRVAPVEKAGRVLSKANENKIQTAIDTLTEVLDQVRAVPADDSELALPHCPECGRVITDPSKGCECGYQVPKAASVAKAADLETANAALGSIQGAIERIEDTLASAGLADPDDPPDEGDNGGQEIAPAEALARIQQDVESIEGLLADAGYPDPDDSADEAGETT